MRVLDQDSRFFGVFWVIAGLMGMHINWEITVTPLEYLLLPHPWLPLGEIWLGDTYGWSKPGLASEI